MQYAAAVLCMYCCRYTNNCVYILVRGPSLRRCWFRDLVALTGTMKVFWLFMKDKGCLKLFVVEVLRKECPKCTNEWDFCPWYFSVCCYSNDRSLDITTSWYISFPFLSFQKQHSSWESATLEGICCFVLLHGPRTNKYLSNVWVIFRVAAKVVASPNQKFDSAYGPEKVHYLASREATEAQL